MRLVAQGVVHELLPKPLGAVLGPPQPACIHAGSVYVWAFGAALIVSVQVS